MQKPKMYNEKLADLKLVSEELNRMIGDGSFYRLSFAQRWTWIRKVKNLYNGLLGPVSSMKLRHVLAAAAVVVMGAGCQGPDGNTLAFAASLTNPFGLTDVGSAAAPCFMDIDNDGDLDAFIGANDGNIYYFRNDGSASSAVFVTAATPFGLADVGVNSAPCFVDIDNDGDLDAFIGEYDGNTYFFQNSGTATAPAFFAPQTNPFGLTDAGFGSAPCFVDMDNDGDLDALIGNIAGNTLFFRNSGTVTIPAFDEEATPSGLIDVGSAAAPCFVDIDNDGDLDAFIGHSDGNTLFFRNTGSASSPAFVVEATPTGLTDVGGFAFPCLADIDNDGDLDAFIGNSDGNLLYFQNTFY